MASTDLVFEGAPLVTGDLVFGDDGGSDISDAVISGAIAIDDPVLQGVARLGIVVGGEVDLGMPVLSGRVIYFTDTQRPTVAKTEIRFQQAQQLQGGAETRFQQGTPAQSVWIVRQQQGLPLSRSTSTGWRDSPRLQVQTATRFQQGLPLGRGAGVRFQQALHKDARAEVRFQQGLPLGRGAGVCFQQGLKIWRDGLTRFQQGLRLYLSVTENEGYGLFIEVGSSTRFQNAILPPHGVRPIIIPPEPDPCYVPSGDLVFDALWSSSTDLVFTCDAHDVPPEPGETIVVPVRRIYTVINTASLRRVDGDVPIPARTMDLAIDVESWTWSFSATVPGSALAAVRRTPGGPRVEVEAMINGVAYRAVLEDVDRQREFGKRELTITGRGKAALLDAPIAPVMSFGNPNDQRLASQLADDVLTFNGVPIGWSVDWHPEDWMVGKGAFSHQGSYMSALSAIANAAGAYIQPHRVDQSLSFLLRYPVAPWEWDTVTPDYELPSAVIRVEGTRWVDKPVYNRVYVSGVQPAPWGVLGQVTRAGTAGNLVAPTVINPMIANALAARQRGLPDLADVGEQEIYSLRMPVLPETGIIPPGKFVRYVDGATERIGIVRTSATRVERGESEALTIWQTLGVETHVNL